MQTCTSSNLQTPTSKEIPESKHQNPSSKHKRNPKFQAPNRGPRFELGIWSLELLWCLELGIWSFSTYLRSRSFATTAAMPSVFIKTYGCQMNERDSEAGAAQLVAKGYSLAL